MAISITKVNITREFNDVTTSINIETVLNDIQISDSYGTVSIPYHMLDDLLEAIQAFQGDY